MCQSCSAVMVLILPFMLLFIDCSILELIVQVFFSSPFLLFLTTFAFYLLLPGLWLFLPASFFLGEFFLVFLPDFFADFLAECLADFLAESLLLRVPFLELREGLPPIWMLMIRPSPDNLDSGF